MSVERARAPAAEEADAARRTERLQVVVLGELRAAHWEFGAAPSTGAPLVAVGWYLEPRPVDGGIPPVVAGLLARASTATARVLFPSFDTHWHDTEAASAAAAASPGDTRVRRLAPARWRDRLVAALLRRPPILLHATTAPAEVERMFDAHWASWSLGGIAFLAERAAPPPELDHATIRRLLGRPDWAVVASTLLPPVVLGVLVPGVDAALVGLLALRYGYARAFLEALERETRAAGHEWLPVASEDDFRTALADPAYR